jgi:hypothetical protein
MLSQRGEQYQKRLVFTSLPQTQSAILIMAKNEEYGAL